MMNVSAVQVSDDIHRPERAPEYQYHLLRAAVEAGKSGLVGLDERQLMDIAGQADKTFELESLVLASPEAANAVIPGDRLNNAVTELAARYTDRAAFMADLISNGLDENILRRALHRELIFDAAMQRVAANVPEVDDLDDQIFFELNKARFTQPERRTVRHILITINEELAENRREAALLRIQQLAIKLVHSPNRFHILARRYSECPTALQDGRLGTVQSGQLYESLDAILFVLPEDAIGGPVESDLGYHLLWCEKIYCPRTLPFNKVKKQIRQLLEKRAARHCQKAWIAELRGVHGNKSSGRKYA